MPVNDRENKVNLLFLKKLYHVSGRELIKLRDKLTLYLLHCTLNSMLEGKKYEIHAKSRST